MKDILYYLTQPNTFLVQILEFCTLLFKLDITCKILEILFNYTSKIKNKILYYILIILFYILVFFNLPLINATFLTIIFSTLVLTLIFKIDIVFAFFASISYLPLVTTVRAIFSKLLSPSYSYSYTLSIPLNYLIIATISYISLYAIIALIKHFKISLKSILPLKRNQKALIIFNLIFFFLVIYVQTFLISYYTDYMPITLVFLNFVGMNSYFVINLYILFTNTSLMSYKESLETEQLYSKSLENLYDNLRSFKHDFNNMVQSLGGYITTKDYDGLETFYSHLLKDTRNDVALSLLSPEIFNNPAIQNLMSSKYYKATKANIAFDMEILLNLNELDISTYDLSRILGILLDNAIEAAELCEKDKRQILIQMYNNQKKNRKLIIIKNTYTNKDINVDLIYTKGYTSKKKNLQSHGLGLPKVRKIITSYSNLNLYTSKDENFFSQQLEIYNLKEENPIKKVEKKCTISK